MRLATWVIIGIVLVIAVISGMRSYNSFINLEEDVENAWSKVESAYQRRADLIPNLVNTVKGYADFEQETLTAVIEARSRASSVQVNTDDLNPEAIRQFQQAQGALSQSLGRLLVTVERYPELKANQNFLELQSQLEGTENRIKVERDRFNDAATEFNKKVRRFPGNLFAGLFGFERKPLFEAEEGAEEAPEVNFE